MVVRASTVELTGNKSTSVFSTGDSYKWKYMYSLTLMNKQISYLQISCTYQLSTDYSTTGGAIEHVKITGSQVLVEQTEHTQTLQSEVTDQVVLFYSNSIRNNVLACS